MNVQIIIGEYLRSHGIKQTYIADKCGWSKQKASGIFRGQQKMSVDDLTKVCDAIGVPYDYFFNAPSDQDSA